MTKFIDLSREIYHRMPRLPNHPSIIITAFSTHEEVREADGYKFSSATMSLALGDHAGPCRRAHSFRCTRRSCEHRPATAREFLS